MANLPQIIGDIPVHSMRKFFVQVKELHSNIIKRKEITENLESLKNDFNTESSAQANQVLEMLCNLKYTKTLVLMNNYFTTIEIDLVNERIVFVRKDKNVTENFKLSDCIEETQDIINDYGNYSQEKWEYHRNFFEYYSIYASNLLFIRGVICEFVKETKFIENRLNIYKNIVWSEQLKQMQK